MYILLTDERAVVEIIPDEDPIFPGIPIEERYPPDFVEELIQIPDGTEVFPNWIYDPESGLFSIPPEPEPTEPDEEEPPAEPAAPALQERVEILEAETAAITKAIERGLSL